MERTITTQSIKFIVPPTIAVTIALSAIALLPAAPPQEETKQAKAKQAPARDPLFFAEDKRIPRAPLFFKEDWQNKKGGEYNVVPENLTNPNLELKLYGAGKIIQVTGSSTEENNPVHVWTG